MRWHHKISICHLYELTNVNVLWVQWSPNGVAQNQDILKNTVVQHYSPGQFTILNQNKQSQFCVHGFIYTLPLHDSQTLTQHPPERQWIGKTRGKRAEKHLWSLPLQLTLYLSQSIKSTCRVLYITSAVVLLLSLCCHVRTGNVKVFVPEPVCHQPCWLGCRSPPR